MRIAIAGGTGTIGRELAAVLRRRGHDVAAFSPSTGVNTVTGHGLREALTGADAIVDVTRPHTFDPEEVAAFFRASAANLTREAAALGARHLLTLSAVGVDLVPDLGFYRAKVEQEQIVENSGVPFTLVRATQFFEFATGIADASTRDGVVHLPPATVQPMASVDVGALLADLALGAPADGVREMGGPERMPVDVFVRRVLEGRDDPRPVRADPDATYFGGHPRPDDLVPGPGASLGPLTLEEGLHSPAANS